VQIAADTDDETIEMERLSTPVGDFFEEPRSAL